MRIVFAFLVWHPDVTNHIDWGNRLYQYLPKGFYSPDANVWNFTWPNQPPGTIYMFGIIKYMFDIVFAILLFVNNSISLFPSIIVSFSESNLYPAMLKLPAIIADFGIAYIFFNLLKKQNNKLAIATSVLFVLLPVIWYNSSVWGQYDSVINFLFLAGFYFADKKQSLLSVICIAVSLYIKISLLILLPVYIVFLLRKNSLTKIVVSSVIGFLLIMVLTVPFSYTQNPIAWLYKIYTEKVLSEQLHVITANAFNFWSIFVGVEWISNSLPLLGKTYEFWGYVLFAIVSIPLYLKALFTKKIDKTLFLSGMIYFAAWLFLTNMHERYLFPFFVFSLTYIVKNKMSLTLYILASLLSLFNMYYLWFKPEIEILITFSELVNKSAIGILFVCIFLYFYKNALFNKKLES